MPESKGLRAAVRDVTSRAKKTLRLEVELARSEIAQKGRAFGVTAGMFVAAAMLGFFAMALTITFIVVLLAIVLPLWLAVLIVLLLVAGTAALLVSMGARRAKGAGGPGPERAIQSFKRTQQAVGDALRRAPDAPETSDAS